MNYGIDDMTTTTTTTPTMTNNKRGRKSLNGAQGGRSPALHVRVSAAQADAFECIGGAQALREWLDGQADDC